MDLYGTMKERAIGAIRSQYAIHALDWIFAQPIFRSIDFVTDAAIPKPTGDGAIGDAQMFVDRSPSSGFVVH